MTILLLVGPRKNGLPEHLAKNADHVGTTVVRTRKLSGTKRVEDRVEEVRRVEKGNTDLGFS